MQTYYGLELKHDVPDHDAHVQGDPVEIKFVQNGEDGDLVLEQGPDGIDPDTQIEIDGKTYDFSLDLTASLPTNKKDGAKEVPDDLQGEVVAVITILDYPEPGDETQMMFLPFADVDEDDMADFGKKHFELKDIDETPDGIPVCFLPGTLIDTPQGPRLVESLRPGDRVSLAGGGDSVLRWVARSHFSHIDLIKNAGLRPVCLAANSLAPGAPNADLWVSQQHRIVLDGWQVELLSGEEEAFAHARHLSDEPAFPGRAWRAGVDYIHLLFDRHEVVVANGQPAESLFLGEQALESMQGDARAELLSLVQQQPRILGRFRRTALPTLKAHEAYTWRRMQAGEPVFEDLVRRAA